MHRPGQHRRGVRQAASLLLTLWAVLPVFHDLVHRRDAEHHHDRAEACPDGGLHDHLRNDDPREHCPVCRLSHEPRLASAAAPLVRRLEITLAPESRPQATPARAARLPAARAPPPSHS